ncbi:MAG: hypothetical protein DRO13_01055 [Thermoprotei archaeon]|nr:MAG: hypothetical protein DRO13_01055 [Thermoprotei archaeon]
MKEFLAVMLVAVLALSLASPTVTSLTNQLRHTPGFPESAELQLEDIVKDLVSILSSETWSSIQSNPEKRQRVVDAIQSLADSGVLESGEAEALSQVVRGGDAEALLEYVKNPELRSILEELLSMYCSEGYVSWDILQAVVNRLQAMYASGAISEEDYLLASEILRRIAEASGDVDLARSLDKELVKTITELVTGEYRDFIEKFMPKTGSVPGASLIGGSTLEQSIGQAGIGLPSASLPSASISPSMPISLETLVPILVALVVVAIVGLLAPRLYPYAAKALMRVRARKAVIITDIRDLPEPIRLYWGSVAMVAVATGVAKQDTETHREYYYVVREKLGPLSDAFRKITTVYEVARFGGKATQELVEKARREYRRLVSSL